MNKSTNTSLNYSEYCDPRLAALYDTVNHMGADSEFFCRKAAELSALSIIDLGCGTGSLTCELAKRGHKMIGVEPAEAMLQIARQRPYSEHVTWIQGGSVQLERMQADLVLMTSHVAQFFLDDKNWQMALKAIYDALKPKGHVVFDSRNPLKKPWESWTRETACKKFNTKSSGPVEMWCQLSEIKNNRVKYEIHYLFLASNEELISINEIIYRSQDEITQSLLDAGFHVENIYGNWNSTPADATSPEIIFVAARN